MKRLNINSIFLAAILGGGGFATREVYKELRSTHDHVLVIQQNLLAVQASLPTLVSKQTFDLVISEIHARQSATEARLSALDAQIQAQQRKP